MAEEKVVTEIQGPVAVVRLDDGKANAISSPVVEAVHAGIDRAEKEAQAVLLLGRAGRFSAGFDLGEMGAGPDAVRRLVRAGADLLLRLYLLPLPVVAGCTGHALAMGSLMLLASDSRIGARGDFKIGLNEVAIRMTLPIFGVELGRARLSKRHLQRAAGQAEIYDPEGAVDAGFLDHAVPEETLQDAALAEAARLAELPRRAFAETKLRLRQPTILRIRETLKEDMAGIGAGGD